MQLLATSATVMEKFRALCPAVGTVPAQLHTGNGNMELALLPNLLFELVKEVTLELHHLPAAEAGHVDVVAFGVALIVVPVSLQV